MSVLIMKWAEVRGQEQRLLFTQKAEDDTGIKEQSSNWQLMGPGQAVEGARESLRNKGTVINTHQLIICLQSR